MGACLKRLCRHRCPTLADEAEPRLRRLRIRADYAILPAMYLLGAVARMALCLGGLEKKGILTFVYVCTYV